MVVIRNTWVEKEKKKKTHETAPSYGSDSLSKEAMYNSTKPTKRYTSAARATMVKTLRGTRK
jgi:hypothetical protein